MVAADSTAGPPKGSARTEVFPLGEYSPCRAPFGKAKGGGAHAHERY